MIKLSALLLNRLCPGEIFGGLDTFQLEPKHISGYAKAFMVSCASVLIDAHTYGCIHACTHMFSAKEMWGEVSYNHTHIWIMSVTRSIGTMSFFFITLKNVTDFYSSE